MLEPTLLKLENIPLQTTMTEEIRSSSAGKQSYFLKIFGAFNLETMLAGALRPFIACFFTAILEVIQKR